MNECGQIAFYGANQSFNHHFPSKMNHKSILVIQKLRYFIKMMEKYIIHIYSVCMSEKKSYLSMACYFEYDSSLLLFHSCVYAFRY